MSCLNYRYSALGEKKICDSVLNNIFILDIRLITTLICIFTMISMFIF